MAFDSHVRMKKKYTWCRSYFLFIQLHKLHHERIHFFSFHIKKDQSTICSRYHSHYLHTHYSLVSSHLYPKQQIVPPSILQQCYVEFIYCQWLFCFTLTFEMHLTYLSPVFLDEDGIMLTNRTLTMLKSTLD